MKKIVLPGGSGFLGRSLAEYLQAFGYEIVILTRGSSTVKGKIKYVHWDGETLGDWKAEIDGCDAVVNFTGKSVNCIYTQKNREEIVESRLRSVSVLQEAILQSENPPPVFVQAGSLAIYGDTTSLCDEEAPHGTGFSVEVCQQWEKVFFEKELPNTRKSLLRIGFALGKNGGALEPLVKLASLYLGGTIGSGKQYISWIHIDDLNNMFRTAIEDDTISGVYNATGPTPVTNKVFMKAVRTSLGKGWSPPAPTPFVKLGAYLIMRADPGLALTGRNCIPDRFVKSNFTFEYTDLDAALRDIIHSSS
ncbi:TIGR01777 family oxidoreductase [Priestia taiwanensis]|uniref:Epimerase n=1 Tax=Priestia taiwanensis TaxID=1347902 RepID=A0A917AJW5_9BACI|nr:TIGR01777 family oxidoreductase [Priestia taiwanensis]MBM7361838.1 uncharacterized protein (TIGR01777 family) [Priestia taiwanensis]GGE57331.1 epimerase [Priestia taiwanensis]